MSDREVLPHQSHPEGHELPTVPAVVVTATFKGAAAARVAARVEDYALRHGATGVFVEEVRVHDAG